ncbi:hypothetical protein ACFQMM_06130 [Saliphagus sp. GCM10025308]
MYREEIRALVESAEYGIESYADRIQHIMGVAERNDRPEFCG